MRRLAIVFGIFLASTSSVNAEEKSILSIDDYIQQVRQNGPDYLNAQDASKLTKLQRAYIGNHFSGSVQASVQRNGNYSWDGVLDYWSKTFSDYERTFWGTSTAEIYASYSLQTPFGITPSVYYQYHRELNNEGATNPYGNDYLSQSINLGFSLDLWRNLFGREIRAINRRDYDVNDAQTAQNAFNVSSSVYLAQNAYWSLACDRAELALRRKTLETLTLLAQQSAGQPKTVLMAEKEKMALELETVLDRERSSRRAFNRIRGKSGDVIDETLLSPAELLERGHAPLPEKYPDRLDIKASRLSLAAAEQELKLRREQTKLSITLYGSAQTGYLGYTDILWTGYEANPWNLDSFSLGAQLTLPLEYFSARWKKSVNESVIDVGRQRRSLRQASEDADWQWEDLKEKLKAADTRLEMAIRREGLEQEKMIAVSLKVLRDFSNAYWAAQSTRDDLGAKLTTLYLIRDRLMLWGLADWYSSVP